MNEHVMHIDDGPSSGCSAISFACVVTSVGERWGNSRAWVFTHPNNSKSFSKKSSFGSCEGSSTELLFPRCGIHATAFISLTCLLSGGDVPYKNAAT